VYRFSSTSVQGPDIHVGRVTTRARQYASETTARIKRVAPRRAHRPKRNGAGVSGRWPSNKSTPGPPGENQRSATDGRVYDGVPGNGDRRPPRPATVRGRSVRHRPRSGAVLRRRLRACVRVCVCAGRRTFNAQPGRPSVRPSVRRFRPHGGPALN